jgi:hypothetical protein
LPGADGQGREGLCKQEKAKPEYRVAGLAGLAGA